MARLRGLNLRLRPPEPMSIAEDRFTSGAQIETARIINVNIEDWSVDCMSELGSKRYLDLQVMAPYFHIMNGEGIYVQPEVGAMCWVCVPSAGKFAAPFVLGFQSTHDEEKDNFRGGRQALNPGDIMLRTRDENFLILRRGGVLQLGSTPICQSMYLPIGNWLKHFCENFGLYTFGGSAEWKNTRTEETTDGNVLSTFTLQAKEKVSSPQHDVVLTIGSHGEGEPTRLQLIVNDSGEEGNAAMVDLAITNEGDVGWVVEKGYAIEAKSNIQITSLEGDITVKADQGNLVMQAAKNINMKADGTDFTAEAAALAKLKGGSQATLDAPLVHLGNGAASQLIKGTELATWLGNLCAILVTASTTPVPPNSPVAALSPVGSLAGQITSLLSTVSFTK